MSSGDPLGELSKTDQYFIKKAQRITDTYAASVVKRNRNNRWAFGLLTLGVISIYTYTMAAVQQEDFLDDFDKDKKTAI